MRMVAERAKPRGEWIPGASTSQPSAVGSAAPTNEPRIDRSTSRSGFTNRRETLVFDRDAWLAEARAARFVDSTGVPELLTVLGNAADAEGLVRLSRQDLAGRLGV